MSLRIKRPLVASDDTFADWMERLVKLIPGEVVGAYVLVRGIGDDTLTTIVWPLIFLGLTFAFRAFTTSEDGKPQWVAALISTGAFIFWVYMTGGNFFGWLVDAQIMSAFMVVYMLVISKVYKGD
jgi:hypothetical protein